MPGEIASYNDLARSVRTPSALDKYVHEYFTSSSADKYSSEVLGSLYNQPHRRDNQDYISFLARVLHEAAEVGYDKIDGHREWYVTHDVDRDLLDPRVVLAMGTSLARKSLVLEEQRESAFQTLEKAGRLTSRNRRKIQATPYALRLHESRLDELLSYPLKYFARLSHKRKFPICPPDSRFHSQMAGIDFHAHHVDNMSEEYFRSTRLPLIEATFGPICDDVAGVFLNPHEHWH